jgi:hypothetical protein
VLAISGDKNVDSIYLLHLTDRKSFEKNLAEKNNKNSIFSFQAEKLFSFQFFPHFDYNSQHEYAVPRDQFIRHYSKSPLASINSIPQNKASKIRCGIFVGNPNATTPINSTSWFDSGEDVGQMRALFARVCAPKKIMKIYDSHFRRFHFSPQITQNNLEILPLNRSRGDDRKLSLVVYQRNLNRRFRNLPSILQQVMSNFSDRFDSSRWTVEIIHHHDDIDPCSLYEVFNRADILLTSHGFQNTGFFLFLLRKKIS